MQYCYFSAHYIEIHSYRKPHFKLLYLSDLFSHSSKGLNNRYFILASIRLEQSPASFFVGGPDGMSRNRQQATRALY